MSGTTLYYNGVWLRDCETKLFEQSIQYDESRTDVMFTRIRLRVTSTLVAYTSSQQKEHESTIRSGASTLNAGSTPRQLSRISSLLNEKGGLLYFYISDAPDAGTVPPGTHGDIMVTAIGSRSNPDTTIPLHPEDPLGDEIFASAVVDVDNGPKPTHVSVEQIFGGRSMRVTFEVEIARRLCRADFVDDYPDGIPEGLVPETPNVLSNRWYVVESKDANWVTTRTLQGTLRVVSKNHLPHLMRYLVVPSLLHGYQRVSQSFASDPSDLVLKYRIEDRQRHEAPPAPAIDWSGEYVEAAGQHGLHQVADFRVRLVGPPGVNKQALLGAAGRVMKERFHGLQKDPGDPAIKFDGILEGSSIVDVIGEPVIELRVRYRFAESPAFEDEEGSGGSDPIPDALRLRLSKIGKPLAIDGYDPKVWPVPLPYDSDSLAGVFTCYLQSPCSVWHGIPVYPPDELEESSQNRPGTQTSGPQDSDARVYPAETPLEIDSLNIDEEEHFGGYPYTFVDIRNRYVTDTGFVQMPLAAVLPSGDTCRVIQLHGGLTKRIFMMEATRVGKPPLIPLPENQVTDPNGITETMLEVSIETHSPDFKADAVSREFRVLSQYTYALSRPPANSEKLRMAVSPIDVAGNSQRYIDAADLFTDNKIEYHA